MSKPSISVAIAALLIVVGLSTYAAPAVLADDGSPVVINLDTKTCTLHLADGSEVTLKGGRFNDNANFVFGLVVAECFSGSRHSLADGPGCIVAVDGTSYFVEHRADISWPITAIICSGDTFGSAPGVPFIGAPFFIAEAVDHTAR